MKIPAAIAFEAKKRLGIEGRNRRGTAFGGAKSRSVMLF